jgi:hypothetical protein
MNTNTIKKKRKNFVGKKYLNAKKEKKLIYNINYKMNTIIVHMVLVLLTFHYDFLVQ